MANETNGPVAPSRSRDGAGLHPNPQVDRGDGGGATAPAIPSRTAALVRTAQSAAANLAVVNDRLRLGDRVQGQIVLASHEWSCASEPCAKAAAEGKLSALSAVLAMLREDPAASPAGFRVGDAVERVFEITTTRLNPLTGEPDDVPVSREVRFPGVVTAVRGNAVTVRMTIHGQTGETTYPADTLRLVRRAGEGEGR